MKRLRLPGLLIVLLLSACGGGGSPAGSSGGGDSGGGAPFGLTSRATVSGLTFPEEAQQSGTVQVVRAFPQLTFTDPLAVLEAPGDPGHRFVATHGGEVWVFDNSDDATAKRLFLDLTDVTKTYDEEGLVSLAFDPDYAHNGFFYVQYYANVGHPEPGDGIIARFHADPATAIADRASQTILLQYQEANSTGHKAGSLTFGPDGKLYTVVGFGDEAGDPNNYAQNLGVVLGKVLRINADGSIPADNPFVGTPGARGEIWAYGMRNPFRIAFDPANGLLWASDVGQYNWEEVDVIVKGGNYGWRVYEGTHVYNSTDPVPPNTIPPIYEYDHSQGCAIIGGFVYRGTRMPAYAGRYFFTDYCSGKLWAITQNNGAFVSVEQVGQIPGNPTSFGVDRSGELYVTSFDGNLYRLAPDTGGVTGTFPQHLSETGLFSNLATLTPAPGVTAYDVTAPLWSDGAGKQRWFALPGTSQIIFDALGPWTFPVGTVVVKQFDLPQSGGADKRMETRVLINYASGWQGYTYRWNDAGTDADLVDDAGITVTVNNVPDGAGGTRTQSYEIPSRGACLECHNTAGRVLGLRTLQANRTHDFGGVTDNQLRSYNHIGLFTADIGDAANYEHLVAPSDTSATLSQRARSYLHGNCSQCHQPGGFASTTMDLRASTPMDQTGTRDVAPQKGDLGITDARIVAPGAKERSVLWQRMQRLDGARMPPLATHVVDADGVALIGQWIDAGAQ